MVTKYVPRKPKTTLPKTVMVLLKKDYPVTAQISDAAKALRTACPDIFKKSDPYPTVRMAKFKDGEIKYEITEGKSSRTKVGLV